MCLTTSRSSPMSISHLQAMSSSRPRAGRSRSNHSTMNVLLRCFLWYSLSFSTPLPPPMAQQTRPLYPYPSLLLPSFLPSFPPSRSLSSISSFKSTRNDKTITWQYIGTPLVRSPLSSLPPSLPPSFLSHLNIRDLFVNILVVVAANVAMNPATRCGMSPPRPVLRHSFLSSHPHFIFR